MLADLDLLARLASAGRSILTGSVALGLMAWRDIDVTTLCPVLAVEPVFEIGRSLAAHPRLRRLGFRNDTGRWNVDPVYPDGLYWGLEYRAPDGEPWNLDLWFLAEGTRQFDLDHLASIPPRLTPETRIAILRIKDAWRARPAYRTTVRRLRHLPSCPRPRGPDARGVRGVPAAARTDRRRLREARSDRVGSARPRRAGARCAPALPPAGWVVPEAPAQAPCWTS